MFQCKPIAQSGCLVLGSAICIERLGSDHIEAIEALLLSLDANSRKSRFGDGTCDTGIRLHARRASREATMLLGAFAERRLCGVLEAYACDTGDMDVALAVELGLRRRGIGWKLLQTAIGQGSLNARGRLRLIFAADNWAMRRIAQKAGARFDLVFGQMRASIDLCHGPATAEWLAAREILRS
jgi:GNAT superfamily N-acetyltransferase